MSLYKRKRGKDQNWWVRFRINKVEIRKSTGTSDRKLAEAFEHQIRTDAYEQTKLGKAPACLWQEATKAWFRDAELRGKAKVNNYESICKWFDEILTDVRLDAIGESEVDEIRETLIEVKKSPATVNRYLSFLRGVLKLAHKKRLADKPPEIESLEEREGAGYALSNDEAKALLDALGKRRAHARVMVEFGLETGLRWSNIANLKWRDVQLEKPPAKSHMHVAASASKSRKAIPVPLSKRAAEIIESQKGNHKTHVFSYAGRAPVGSIKTAFKAAAEQIELPALRFHDIRHTWATRQVSKGVPLKVVAELGGWRSTQMLEERYSHLRRDDLAAYVD